MNRVRVCGGGGQPVGRMINEAQRVGRCTERKESEEGRYHSPFILSFYKR